MFAHWSVMRERSVIIICFKSFNGKYFKLQIKMLSFSQQLKFSALESKWWMFKTYKIKPDNWWDYEHIFY